MEDSPQPTDVTGPPVFAAALRAGGRRVLKAVTRDPVKLISIKFRLAADCHNAFPVPRQI
jgi:hypothetical protein